MRHPKSGHISIRGEQKSRAVASPWSTHPFAGATLARPRPPHSAPAIQCPRARGFVSQNRAFPRRRVPLVSSIAAQIERRGAVTANRINRKSLQPPDIKTLIRTRDRPALDDGSFWRTQSIESDVRENSAYRRIWRFTGQTHSRTRSLTREPISIPCRREGQRQRRVCPDISGQTRTKPHFPRFPHHPAESARSVP